MQRTILVALAVTVPLAAGCIGGQDDEAERVTLTNDGFGQQQLTVDVGQQVVWINEADQAWNLSAEQRDGEVPIALGVVEPGNQTVQSFDRAGTFEVSAERVDGTGQDTMVVEVQEAGGPTGGPTY